MLSHFARKLASLASFGTQSSNAVRVGKWEWTESADGEKLFGTNGPDLEAWLADPRTEVVKSAAHRTVYRVTLPTATVYVKCCRITGFRSWAREILRPAKARLEYENAVTLQERGVPGVVPLAWGGTASRWPGESVLITLSQDGMLPFLHFLEVLLPTLPPLQQRAVRRQVARGLGHFLAKLHDAGVAHPDPHPGNILIELPGSGVPHFALIDVHAVWIGAPLSWRASRANLIVYNRWFQLRASRADRYRFWRSYRIARQTLPLPIAQEDAQQGRELEAGTLASNLRFWAGRQSRCLGTNRYFHPVTAGTLRGFAVRDLPHDLLTLLLHDPDALFHAPCARLLKDSRSSTVAELTLPSRTGTRVLIWKRVNARSWLAPFKNLLRPSGVLRSWVNGHSLRDRWLPTPRPLALLHRHRGGFPAEGYLLTEVVPAAEPLHSAGAHLFALARVVRALHDRGVSHRDLKAPNVLLAHGNTPSLIDLVGVRLGRVVSFRTRVKELARLNASLGTLRTVTAADRLAFLHAYLAAGPRLPQGAEAWWEAIENATATKVKKNRRSGRPLA